MTTEHSTYTYETGEQETVTLKRGPGTPHGRALLKIEYSGGGASDCYVDLAWLRGRLNDLDPRPLTPDAITDEMVERARNALRQHGIYGAALPVFVRNMLRAALTEPPARPEGAEEIEALISKCVAADPGVINADIADFLVENGVRVDGGERP